MKSSFGILRQKFEDFQKRIRIQPKFLDAMIIACTCLHNYTLGDFRSEDVSVSNYNILQNYSVDSQDITGIQNVNAMEIRDGSIMGIRNDNTILSKRLLSKRFGFAPTRRATTVTSHGSENIMMIINTCFTFTYQLISFPRKFFSSITFGMFITIIFGLRIK